MSALTIMILRHAEKMGGAYPGPGLSPDGTVDDKSLAIRGWQRAGAWSALLGSGGLPDYPLPSVIYAAKPTPFAKGAKCTHRSYETAEPLAKRLGLEVTTWWGVGQEEDLVKEIVQLTGVVVVFWEHKAIGSTILPRLFGKQELSGVPTNWGGDRFDVILRLDRALPGAPWTFRQLSPRLLAGDSDAPFNEHIIMGSASARHKSANSSASERRP